MVKKMSSLGGPTLKNANLPSRFNSSDKESQRQKNVRQYLIMGADPFNILTL